MLWIAIVTAFALGTMPRADAAEIVPADLALTLSYEASDGVTSGTATLTYLDGDVALEMVNEGEFRLFALLRSGAVEPTFTVHLYGPDGDGWSLDVTEAATLDALMSDDVRYEEFADVLLLMLNPVSPLHPCVRTVPEDGVLEGDFSVWECSIVETTEVAGRSATRWSLENLWGRSGTFAIFNDPEEFVWIDDAFGVPLRYETPEYGFVVRLVEIDTTPPDPARFRAP